MIAEFHWILPGRLAGSACPGLFGVFEQDLGELARLEIRHIVTLTEQALRPVAPELSIEVTHFPIDDMGIPTPRCALELCRMVLGWVAEGEAVLLHCKAGLGRTGTMLGCCLITLGRTPEEALREVRRACRNYLQTPGQERFLFHYAESMRSGSGDLPRPSGGEARDVEGRR